MINDEISNRAANIEVHVAKATLKEILKQIQRLRAKAKQHGGLDNLIKHEGKEMKLKLYTDYMENDSMSLLNDEFDYMIDELRENGQLKENAAIQEEDNDLVNVVGNIVGDVEVVERENKNGEPFKVANFSIVSNDENGDKFYTNCSAYGEKSDITKEFKQGDFIKVFGQIRTSMDDNGKEYSNVRVLSSKLLKAKEQMKNQVEDKDSVLGAIKKYKAEEQTKSSDKKETSKEAER